LIEDASLCIAVSNAEAKQYREAGINPERIRIIPNSVDLDEFTDLPHSGVFKKRFGIPEEKQVVLFIGRIHQIKGIDLLVSAFYKLLKTQEFPNTVLVVVGPDDGYLKELIVLIRRLGLQKSVYHVGPLYGRAKLEAYVDADIVVVPSRYEIFGNVVLESYACYKPVIASKVGGLPEIVINGKTGLLVNPEDTEELASAMATLLSNTELRKWEGLNANRLVRSAYSSDVIAAKTAEAYRYVASH
jgi:glycosyltransferase involved in cell wall biosynthesis